MGINVPPWLIWKIGKWWHRTKPLRKLGIRKEDDMKLIKSAQKRTLVRSALKVVGTVLVTVGVVDAGQVDTAVTAVQAIGGGLLTLWGLWLSAREKRAA